MRKPKNDYTCQHPIFVISKHQFSLGMSYYINIILFGYHKSNRVFFFIIFFQTKKWYRLVSCSVHLTSHCVRPWQGRCCAHSCWRTTPRRGRPPPPTPFDPPDRRRHSNYSRIAYYFLPTLLVAVGGRDMYDGMPSVVVSIIYLCVFACIFVLCVRVYLFVCACACFLRANRFSSTRNAVRSVKAHAHVYIIIIFIVETKKRGEKNWIL